MPLERALELKERIGPTKALALALDEQLTRRRRELFAAKGGLKHFVKYFWDSVEPAREYVHGWALDAIFDHLEAVADGKISRLVINIPPGSMKSLSANVFFPAWVWACRNQHARFLAFSYTSQLTERDNQRFLDLLQSEKFVKMYGRRFDLREKGKIKVSNSARGWKLASSVEGVGTGERGDFVIVDDGHNVAEGESKKVRESTVRWFMEAASNRLNDMDRSAIIVIGQRVHESDICGAILKRNLGYTHLMIPMEYDQKRAVTTGIGWSDPRQQDGECFFPERFPPSAVEICRQLGSFAWSSQYQQSPEIRDGGLLPRSNWVVWNPENGKFPQFDYIVASLDPAFTSKDSNDPSALTVWGAFKHKGRKCAMLIWAWRKWLKMHGHERELHPGETLDDYRERCQHDWGLVETVAEDCRRFKVHRLLIEPKASGLTVAQEFIRLFPDGIGIELVDPKRLDKEARVIRVQGIFENGQIFHPDRRFAEMVIDECAKFPRDEHDDLVDSATQAVYHLRQNGFLQRDDEMLREHIRRASDYRVPAPLYPALGI